MSKTNYEYVHEFLTLSGNAETVEFLEAMKEETNDELQKLQDKIHEQKDTIDELEEYEANNNEYKISIDTHFGKIDITVIGSNLLLQQIVDRLKVLLEDKQTPGGEMRVLKVLNFIK